MSRHEGHTHRDAQGTTTGLLITTHTVGQEFGTIARVTNPRNGAVLHETDVRGLGSEEASVSAARKWIDAQRFLPAGTRVATP